MTGKSIIDGKSQIKKGYKREMERNQGKKEQEKRDNKHVASFAATGRINTDPDGTWTGVNTEDAYEKPIQDADDL